MQNIELFPVAIFIYGSAKNPNEEKSKEEQTLAELCSAHCRSQAECHLGQTSYISELNCSCFCHTKHVFSINRAQSVCMGESRPR